MFKHFVTEAFLQHIDKTTDSADTMTSSMPSYAISFVTFKNFGDCYKSSLEAGSLMENRANSEE